MSEIPAKEWNENLDYILKNYREFIIAVGKV